MKSSNKSPLSWLAQAVILAQVLGVPVLVILATLDLPGWRTFVSSVAMAFISQAIVALILYILLRSVLSLLKDLIAFSRLTPLVLIFVTVLALSLLPSILHRPVDIYDVVQTIPLIVDLNLLVSSFERVVGRDRQQRARPRQPRPSSPATPLTRTSSTDSRALYRDLLLKVGGDRGTAERLIEYERRRAPSASRDELVMRAIETWKLDNRW